MKIKKKAQGSISSFALHQKKNRQSEKTASYRIV